MSTPTIDVTVGRPAGNEPGPWTSGKGLAFSLVVNVEEGSEHSLRDGDRGPEPVDELGIAPRKPIRSYANESNYAYGIKAGGPRVLDLLERHRVRATFTAAALSLERAPELTARIVAGGHEVCSHGWRWIHQFRMNETEERDFIRKAADSIERTTGKRPAGWLSRYLTTEHTARLLAEEGFRYHMDDYSDDVPFWQDVGSRRILVMPYALDSNDMKFWTAPGLVPADWLGYALDTFECLYDEARYEPRMMSVGVHLRIIGRPGRIGYLDRLLAHVTERPGVCVTTRTAMATRWAELNG